MATYSAWALMHPEYLNKLTLQFSTQNKEQFDLFLKDNKFETNEIKLINEQMKHVLKWVENEVDDIK